MERTHKSPFSRILSLLLAICIAVGFVPLIDYSAFAVDNETTIGELVDGISKSGNGWNWDGSTLELFGAELKSKDDSTPKISYSGETLTINVKGYNHVSGNSLLAKVGEWEKINITGSGILESDSTGALFSGFEVIVDDALIKAPKAKLFDDTKNLTHNSGYLEIGTLNGSVTMTSGVIKCDTLSSGSITQNGGVFYVETLNAGKPINCNKGAIFKVNTITGGADYSITCNNGSIVISGVDITGKVSGQTGKTVDNLYVYCDMVANDTVKSASDNNGSSIYYAASEVNAGDDVTLDGAVYFAGEATLDTNKSFTVADGATVAGGKNFSIECNKATIGESSTVCFDLGIILKDATVNGGVYGCLNAGSGDRMQFHNSTIEADGSVYSLSCYSMFYNSTINGSVTVYGTGAAPLSGYSGGNTKINGKIYLYDSSNRKQDLVGDGSWTFGEDAELAGYTSAGKICDDDDNGKAFDTAIGSRAFYTAADLGEEFTATVSGYRDNCGKVIYIGDEFEERFDTAFSYSPSIYDGHYRTYKSLQLSLDPADDQKVVLAYNSTHDIDLNDVKVSITKGIEDFTSGFDIKLSHYYYTDSPDKAIARSLGVEISATSDYKLVAGDEYKVTVKYGGMTQAETIEVTGTAIALNFTGEYNTAPPTWTYDGVLFTDPATDYEANTWAWYANENTQLGYPAKTLVLNNIDLASSRFNAVIVPDGTTIILKGENKLYAITSAIRCNGNLTIIGKDGGSLTAISRELAADDRDGSSFDAVIKTYGYSYETHDILIKDAKLDLTAKKAAKAGGSNINCTNCYGICSSGNVTIENSEITAYAGPVGQDGLISACIMAKKDIILRGNTSLGLTSEQYALYAGNSIKSIELSRLQGADVTLEDFNSSLKNNGSAYNGSISGTSVSLVTKPIEQLDDAKTADVLDPDDGEQTLSLSKFFSGGTGTYAFELADGVTLPSWVTLAQDGTLTFNAPNIKYAGGKYKLTVADSDPDLRSDPLEFTLVVGKIGRTVNLTVEYDSTLGTVEPETGKVLAGEDAYIEADAKDGAYIESVTLDGKPMKPEETEKNALGRITKGLYIIENIDSDHTVSVTFKEIPTYKVSVTANNGGTVKVETEPRADYTYTEGTEVVISAVADGGYRIKSVTLDGAAVKLTDGKYTIKSITANCTFAVEFEEIPTYTVTVTANNGGTVTAETAALAGKPDYTYTEGTDVVISALAADGYRIKSVTLDGAAVKLTDGKYTIKSITANCTFAVEFEEIPTYEVKISCGEHGTYTTDYTGALTAVREGTVIKFTTTPDSGYALKKATVNGDRVKASASGFSVTITGPTEIEITFGKSSSGGGGGSSNRPSADTDVSARQPYIKASSSVKGWTDIAAYIRDNAAALRGKETAIVLNGNSTVPEDVLKAAKAAKCTLRFITDDLGSLAVDPAESTAGFNAMVSVSGSSSNITLGAGAVPAFAMTTGSRTAYAFSSVRITAALGSGFGGKTATLVKYEGGRYIGVTAAAADANGAVTFDFADISGGTYYIALGARNYVENDVNGDNRVDIKDASLVLKQAFGVLTEKEQEALLFDNVIPADGKLSIADAQRILKSCFN